MSEAEESKIRYSEMYSDDTYDYRHIILPPSIAEKLPATGLLHESQWQAVGVGVNQADGWEHFMRHRPEPHILLFRRPRKKKTAETASSSSQPRSRGIKRKASST